MYVATDDTAQPYLQMIPDMKRAGELVLKREGLRFGDDEAELDVSFVSKEEIQELNRNYREIDKSTDVLSFPQYEDIAQIREQDGFISLGDVILCPEIAREQAEEFGHSFQRELLYLYVHSIHHLLGYDHMEESERREMRKAEEEIMQQLNLPEPDAPKPGEQKA